MTGFGAIAANRRRSSTGTGVVPIDPATLALFAFYDPADMASLFQDGAGTVPVTASGQPVGRMLDKSGNGRHFTQNMGGPRPTYIENGGLKYLAFDGVDDNLYNGNFALGGTFDRITAISNSDDPDSFIGWWVGNDYEHMLYLFNTGVRMETQNPGGSVTIAGALAQGASGVIAERHNGASSRIKIDNLGYVAGTLGTPAVTTMQLNRGGAGEQGQGHFFGAAMRAIGTPLTDAEIDGMVAWFAAKQGRTL